ncbi:hypothetical protein HMPREF9488_02247 [Coprobacillus cateniformis]|uniref:Uncharacterized protein n=1 Tax=Coprobacillus cateniformis TaxID=100884 RepID=E7GBV6_9FIRM|nr:hypothetical protein HMPREF9488_02247 [Coprobacillus cateniformis]
MICSCRYGGDLHIGTARDRHAVRVSINAEHRSRRVGHIDREITVAAAVCGDGNTAGCAISLDSYFIGRSRNGIVADQLDDKISCGGTL